MSEFCQDDAPFHAEVKLVSVLMTFHIRFRRTERVSAIEYRVCAVGHLITHRTRTISL